MVNGKKVIAMLKASQTGLRKLGTRQQSCLKALKKNHGSTSGWAYGSASETMRILGALEKKGLISKRADNYGYDFTDAGRQITLTLGECMKLVEQETANG